MAERRLTKLQQAAREVSDLQEAVSDAIARDEHLELATWRICVVCKGHKLVRVRIRKKLPEIAISLEKVEDKHRHRQVIPFLV